MAIRGSGIALVSMALAGCTPPANPGNLQDTTNIAAPGNATAVVQPLPTPARSDYPPCSATITDHCVQR